MRDLNFFQAERLVVEQRRAVRRAGWDWWWIWRGISLRVWWEDGVERRAQMDADHWRGAEFLAKDFTDKPWPGGSFPACATVPPITDLSQIPPLLGSGTFTLDPLRCGGAGNGGLTLDGGLSLATPIPVDDPYAGIVPLPEADEYFTLELKAWSILDIQYGDHRRTPGGQYLFPHETLVPGSAPVALVPDGGICWVDADTCFYEIVATAKKKTAANYARLYAWIAREDVPNSVDSWVHTGPFVTPEPPGSAGADHISRATPTMISVVGAAVAQAAVPHIASAYGLSTTPLVVRKFYVGQPFAPGQVVRARAEFHINGVAPQVITATYTHAPDCP